MPRNRGSYNVAASVDPSPALFSRLTTLFDELSRRVFRISLGERHERTRQIAEALRVLSRQPRIVCEAIAALEELLASPPEDAMEALLDGDQRALLVGAPLKLRSGLAAYRPDPAAVANAPDPVADALRTLDRAVEDARRTCERIEQTTQLEGAYNVENALRGAVDGLRGPAAASDDAIRRAIERLPPWARRRAEDR